MLGLILCVMVITIYIFYKGYISNTFFSESKKENQNTKKVGSGWMQKNSIKEKAMNHMIENYSDNTMIRESERYQKGEDYFYGRNGKPQDYYKALFFYEKAASEGHVESAYSSGYLQYYEHKGVYQDYVSAFKWFSFAAERGHAKAQRLLGECYAYGYGTQKDNELAAIWLLRVAEKNDDKAAKTLGDICCREMDWDNAYVWYNKAVLLGNIPANLDLAFCYYNAWG